MKVILDIVGIEDTVIVDVDDLNKENAIDHAIEVVCQIKSNDIDIISVEE